MKISSILNQNKPTLSFEVFPPKNLETFDNIKKATHEIALLNPSFVSITYGAGGSTSKYTLDIAENIQNTTSVPCLAHLTCVGSKKENVLNTLKSTLNKGIYNILALRGDIPQNEEFAKNSWDYKHAVDLVREIKNFSSNFCVGGACYPEIHPESKNQKEDILYLKEKVDAGCEFLTTQMFFDNNLLYNFLYKIREAGIKVPVIAGIMPITNANQIERAISLSHSFIPQRFKTIVDKFKDNPLAMKQAGIAYATDQIIDLYANGINHVHIYTMNKPDVAKQIQSNISEILK